MKISNKLTSFDLQQFVFKEELFFRNLRCVNFDGKESCFVSLLMLWRKKISIPFWRLLPKKREITATGYFRRSLHQWKSPVLLMKKRRISIIGFSVWYFWKTRNEDMSRFRRFLQRKKSYTVSLSILRKKIFPLQCPAEKNPKEEFQRPEIEERVLTKTHYYTENWVVLALNTRSLAFSSRTWRYPYHGYIHFFNKWEEFRPSWWRFYFEKSSTSSAILFPLQDQLLQHEFYKSWLDAGLEDTRGRNPFL